ncbi:NACHT domain-containing protein [Streptomyces chartreusis]|uniref:hypothetical protein n=1 Tax=Streptomyces chartreusis TaxID=1969 RepID=UPI003661B03B
MSTGTDDLLDRLTALLPFSARSRSRAQALSLAARSSRARSMVRLRSTPADRVEAALVWRTEQADPVVEVPAGALRVLVTAMGAGKSEEAERWWSEGLTQACAPDAQVEIPVWLEAREVTASLAGAVQEALGADPVRECRIVVDNLDAVSPKRADQLLTDARHLVATWPQARVLATTRPGAGSVDQTERLDVAAWPVPRGWSLLRTVLGEDYYLPGLDAPEMQQLLTSPLQVHALASRLQAGGDAQVTRRELLSGLARSILERERPEASREVWENLPRLATEILDQQGPVQAASFARQNVIWELEQTGIVVHDGGLLRFALPLFEQHFAAQALQDEVTLIETAAGSDHFPRWRYAIAFAVATATREDAEAFLLRLARTNPAAASWVLEETAQPRHGAHPAPASANGPAAGARSWDDGPEPALALGGWLREATLAWLEGVGELGLLLAPHHQGVLAPWGVFLDQEHQTMAVGHAREGVLDADLVVQPELHPWEPFPIARFHDRYCFAVPRENLARWVWARDRLRRQLARQVINRTLPVPPDSALAAERTWFLAQLITAKGHSGRPRTKISLDDLRAEVDELMTHVESTVRSRWHWGRYTVDSDDVRWLHGQLQHLPGDTLPNPRPPADRSQDGTRYIWQTYSPALTLSITKDVVRDALTGYRDLVQRNFPRFGAALGLYSIFPARAEGVVIMPQPDDTDAYSATVAYTLRHDGDAHMQDAPTVDIDLAEEPNVPGSLWDRLQEEHASVFHRPSVQYEELSTGLERQATNLAYSWLARDLKAVGWLEEPVTFPE